MKLTQIEGKSPHKKGSAKYKKHMAAKHAAMGEKVEALKELVERAKQVKANSKFPKKVPPNPGHESPHPYKGKLVGENKMTGPEFTLEIINKLPLTDDQGRPVITKPGELDADIVHQAYILFQKGVETDPEKAYLQAMNYMQNMSMESEEFLEAKGDIRKALLGLGVAGAVMIGGSKIADYMNKSAYSYSIQLPQLEMYLDYAESQNDQRMIKQLQDRIRQHKGRLELGYGDLNGPDGSSMSFEVVYDKENPDFDPLGDPMALNMKFDAARKKSKNESKNPDLPKQSNLVAKHSRNMSGAGAHKDKKKAMKKGEVKHKGKELEEAVSADMQNMFNELRIDDNTNIMDGNKKLALDEVGPGFYLLGYDRDGSCFEMNKISKERAKDSITGYGEYKVADADITDFNGARYYYNENMPDSGILNIKSLPAKKESIDEAKMSGTKNTLVQAVTNELKKKALEEDGEKLLKRLANILGKKITTRDNGSLMLERRIPFSECPLCGDEIISETELLEAKKKKKAKKDACYHKVKARYKVWPSAYASGALVQCRKKGAKNWGNKSKKK